MGFLEAFGCVSLYISAWFLTLLAGSYLANKAWDEIGFGRNTVAFIVYVVVAVSAIVVLTAKIALAVVR